MKKSLKVITKHTTLSFAEMDCLLSEASYLVNSRPLQPNPTAGEDGFICPNDVMMGRSDMEPPNLDITDTSLAKRASHKQKIIAEFWDKWSSSYFQSLVKFHRWQSKSRNATAGDVVMILDKEAPKGKFIVGIIDSVKVDPDNQVRKVIVKYKTKSVAANLGNVFKYTQRNVRGLALLIKAEERGELTDLDLDNTRFSTNMVEEEESGDHGTTMDTVEEANQVREEEDDPRRLTPTSSIRKRRLPARFVP